MIITIGILAHVDAGKTTFAEQILYHTNSIRNRGRVDHQSAFLDSHSIEKERGITVFSDQAVFDYKDNRYYLIDTPGHVDFSTEMERAISVMDYAVIIISGVEGVQGHTETVWQLLKKHHVPTFFFINKMDRDGSNVEDRLEEIREHLTGDVFYISGDTKEDLKGKLMHGDLLHGDSLDAGFVEFAAERDETILDIYMSGAPVERTFWINSTKRMIKECRIFSCLSGSALQDVGIEEFLENLDLLTLSNYENNGKKSDEEEFSGRIYKIRHDEQGNRITFIKALSGSLSVKDEITFNEIKDRKVENQSTKIEKDENRQIENRQVENRQVEKVNQIRIYNGSKFATVDRVSAGDLFGVTGLKGGRIGDGVGALQDATGFEVVPTMKSRVNYDNSLNAREVLHCFRLLEVEDPALNITWDEHLQEIQVHVMGAIQLEVLKQLVEERYHLRIDFGPCEILYKETISEAAIGYGHFEPLGHYAEVHLKLEPGERNSGIIFENRCHADDMTVGNQNLVRTHIFEREHHGILTGSVITDMKITLLTGRAHNMHTSGGDFREATIRALRQGLESTDNVLLEPYYRFKIEAEMDYMGRILSDIQKMSGTFDPPEILDNKVRITGRGPVANFMNYSMEFVSITKGKGRLNFTFDKYDVCHNEEEVIKRTNYDKNADIEYPSASIFCSKGQGYTVSGSEAKGYMHCECESR